MESNVLTEVAVFRMKRTGLEGSTPDTVLQFEAIGTCLKQTKKLDYKYFDTEL